MRAIILAGGKGKRLYPITASIPKPMAKICNEPCIGRIINLLHRHGIYDIAVTLGYKGEIIAEYLKGIKGIEVYYEDTPLGTAGSVKKCEGFIKDDFLVIAGDCVTDFDLTKAVEYHKAMGGIATVITAKSDNPVAFGGVITDNKGRITGFTEKPGWEEIETDEVNTGIYIFKREILDYIPKGEYDFGMELFPKLLNEHRIIYACRLSGYWQDMGSIEAYKKCNMDMLSAMPVQLLKRQGRGLKQPSLAGEGTIWQDAVIGPYAIIGKNCSIGNGAVVKNCVIGDNVVIGRGAFVSGIVEDGCKIGARAKVDSAVLGDNCIVGRDCFIASGVCLYPKTFVADGKRVTLSPASKRQYLFGEGGIFGDVRNELTPTLASLLGRALSNVFHGEILIGFCGEYGKVLSMALASALSAGGLMPIYGECACAELRYISAIDNCPCVYIKVKDNNGEIYVFNRGLPIDNSVTKRIIDGFFYGEDIAVSEVTLPHYSEKMGLPAQKRLGEIMGKINKTLLIYGDELSAESLRRVVNRCGGGLSQDIEVELRPNGGILISEGGLTLHTEDITGLISLYEPERELPVSGILSPYLCMICGITPRPYTTEDYLKYPYLFDGYFAAGKILSLMQKYDTTLKKLWEEMPAYCRKERVVMGKRASVITAIRKIVPNADNEGRGLVLRSKDGFIELQPLLSTEGFRVLSYAANEEMSKELSADLTEVIKSIDKE